MGGKVFETRAERALSIAIHGVLVVIGVLAIYPILYVLVSSVSDPTAVNAGKVFLWPIGFQLNGYQLIFKSTWILTGYRNSLYYTIVGTLINLIVTFLAAYALSRKDLFGRQAITLFMIIPMWFGGGLIPTFLTVNSLNLVDKPYTLLILGAISMYNCVICRTFLTNSIPHELQESAKIDGASDYAVALRIMLPLSAPIMAVLSLYYGIGHWNGYFTGLIYLNNRKYQPLQVFLREILIQSETVVMTDGIDLEAMALRTYIAQVMRYGLIVVSSLPMLILYPFLQRYFVKGVMIGALKG